MMPKILVTYATRTGSTQGVAEVIAKTIAEHGIAVEVCPMNQVTDLTSYSAVVAGSAIQASAWLPEAVDFISSHWQALNKIPLATFHVCLTLAMKNGEKYRSLAADFVKPVRLQVKPVAEAQFAGVLDLRKLRSGADRFKFALSVLLGVWKTGDHRDWNAIRSWTEEIIPKLQ